MKANHSPRVSPDSDAFIDEIHQIEEKINLFLTDRRREAEGIVEAGRREAERLTELGRRAAEEEGAKVAAGILEQARAEATLIEEKGREAVSGLGEETAPRRAIAKATILGHLLGRNP